MSTNNTSNISDFDKVTHTWLSGLTFSDTSVSGSGSVSNSGQVLKTIQSGATSNSHAHAIYDGLTSYGKVVFPNNSTSIGSIDFDKMLQISFVFSFKATTANGVTSMAFPYDDGDLGTAAPTWKSIGIRVDDNALKGVVHDGAIETIVDLGITVTAWKGNIVRVKSDGKGNVEWFVNGVSKGTTDKGPVGTINNKAFPSIYTKNGADSSNQNCFFQGCWIQGWQ